ncbi:MAG: sigma-70 family RNA polymerase sigma factor [Sphingomonas sp.]|jgi:RNA polymerase sigma-70 factor (ECF subfamily)|uniref:sigma-70 family RNA polymerase sigma factor n=1 Tax=Sphingomonas sp. TaxID=28214 RepID=UPI003564CFD7
MSASEEMIGQIQPLIPALRRYARAMLRDRDDADDLVQDVLERAISRWHGRRQMESLRSWLFAILHNLALDRLRRRARQGTTEPLDAAPEDRLGRPATQEMAVEREDVLALVATLPEEQRSVLLLIGVEQLSYAEAAAVLDVPQGTVMSRLSRARERLRRLMDGQPAERPALRIVP